MRHVARSVAGGVYKKGTTKHGGGGRARSVVAGTRERCTPGTRGAEETPAAALWCPGVECACRPVVAVGNRHAARS